MASIFSEPKSFTVVFSTVIAILELINVLGFMDNLILIINSYDILPEISVIEGKEKLVFIPSSMEIADTIFANPPHSMWGELGLARQDYLIIAFLATTLLRLWINNPARKLRIENYRKKTKMISLKSKSWLFLSFFSIVFYLIFIANKFGRIAKIYEGTGFKEFPEGARLNLFGDPRWVEPLPNLGLFDLISSILFLGLIILCLKRAIKIRLPKKTKSDKLTIIEKVWRDTDEAISIGYSRPKKSLPMVNDAFSDLIDLLSASAAMNIAATALEDGDVKTSFDRWGALTSPDGKDSEKWRGLSDSLSDIGNFEDGAEEE